MKSSLKVILALVLLHMSAATKSQTLGTYPNATVISGQNATVTPGAAPTNTTSVVAYTNTSFTGLLTVNPTTGVVTITDAKQAGVFPVTVKAFGATPVTSTFTLTVTNPGCSQTLFRLNNFVDVGYFVKDIAVGDFNEDGKQDFVTAGYSNYSDYSILIGIGDGAGGFLWGGGIKDEDDSESVAVGDFNGDGRQDLAIIFYGHNSVSIRLGNNAGGFTATNDVAVGIQPANVAIGDFNGDGRQDIATANNGSNTVSIRLGNGTGGFTGATEVAVEIGPTNISIGDFNGDGRQDIVTACYNSNNYKEFVSIRIGDGFGNFSGTTNLSGGKGNIAIGDFNGDDKQDIAIPGYNSPLIRLGNGSGGFMAPTEPVLRVSNSFIAIGDFNGDGKQDLATSEIYGEEVSILLGNGAGGLKFSTQIKTDVNTDCLAAGDFNSDGFQDLVVGKRTHINASSIILGGAGDINLKGNNLNIADGDDSPSVDDYTDFGSISGVGNKIVRTFTLQNTGTTDLKITGITSSNLSFALVDTIYSPIGAGGSATFSISFSPTVSGIQNATITINNNGCDEAVYDFAVTGKGEGILPPKIGNYPNTILQAGQNTSIIPDEKPGNAKSIVAYSNTSFSGTLSVNPTTGVLTVSNAMQAGVYPVTVKAFGVEIVSTIFTLTITNPYCSQGLFRPSLPVVSDRNLPYSYSMAVGDFNGDGKQDLVRANSGGTVTIQLGDGAGGFTGVAEVGVGSNPYGVAVGDFNGDGSQDVVTANYSINSVSIRLGDGAGGLSRTKDIAVGTNPNSVAIGDFNGDGRQDLATANYSSNTVSIRLGDGAGGFNGTTEVNVGLKPRSVAIGDFNSDGNQDIVVANSGNITVSILLGNGAGEFPGNTIFFTVSGAYSIAIGDFNGDAKQDLAISNNAYSAGRVYIYQGDGAGGFTKTTEVNVGKEPCFLALGDFNGDGNQDIAVSNFSSYTVSILLGDGAGKVKATKNVSVNSSFPLAIGDFNGDGRQDLTTANNNHYQLSIRLGAAAGINVKGNGVNIADGDLSPASADHTDFGTATGVGNEIVRTFTIQNTGVTDLHISAITIDDTLFRLGELLPAGPIAAGNSASFTVTFSPTEEGVRKATIVIQNDDCDEALYDFAVTANGAGIFPPTIGKYANTTIQSGMNIQLSPDVAPSNVKSIVAYSNTNFTGILTVNRATGVVSITNAKQAGVYAVTVKIVGAGTITTTFILTVTNPGCSQGLFTGTTNVVVGANSHSVAVGDFNGDGIQDFAAVHSSNNSVSIRLGNGTGGFSGNISIIVGTDPNSVAIGDFNADGIQDFATADNGSNSVSVRLGDGAGGFTGTTKIGVGFSPRIVVVGDFNGDGWQDLATTNNSSAGSVSIRLGDGMGGFSGTTEVSVGSNPVNITVGDFNSDGWQDFATSNHGNNSVSIRLGDGAGGFTGLTNLSVGTYPRSIAIGDFNTDGKQDLAVGNYGSNTVSILFGDGLGGFVGTTNVGVGNGPQSITVGDFNGDGKQDIATADRGSNSASIRFGDGVGSFTGSTNVIVGASPYSIVVGDFNGDAIQDIATANNSSISVSIRLGGAAEINVKGNNIDIMDGDNIPDAADHTDFGSINPGTTLIGSFTIQNRGTTPLSISNASSSNPLFVLSTAPSSIAAGSSATLTVTFSPTVPGVQNATFTINNNDCDEAVYDFAVTGTGFGEGIFTWYKDADNDGYSDGTSLVQVSQPAGYKLSSELLAVSGDCNDGTAAVHPGATEICDGLDNDCNGIGDEGLNVTWYKDADNDGYSDGSTLVQCSKPVGYKLAINLLATSGDCNDANANINPGATEQCDGIDNDCDGQIDGEVPAWYKDADNDGYSDGTTLVQCTKPAGYKLPANLTAISGDCDDASSNIFPGAPELCDGLDNDCDAQSDEGCPVGTAWYFDYDKDGYGNAAKVVYAVTQPYKYVANPDDCKDWDAAYHPGATELCDGKDNDCDGLIDEGCPGLKTWYRDGDHDGYGNPKYTKTTVGQPTGFVANADDCKDWDANVYPGQGCPPGTGIVGTDGNATQPKAMLETSAEIRVFPNPARDEITVTLNGFEAGNRVELTLVQADGKCMLTQSITPFRQGQQVRMDIRQASAGFYLLLVRQGQLQQAKRVIILR